MAFSGTSWFRIGGFSVSYIVTAIALSFFNKAVFESGFPFPVLVTWFQTLGTLILIGFSSLLPRIMQALCLSGDSAGSCQKAHNFLLQKSVNCQNFITKMQALGIVTFLSLINVLFNTWSLTTLDVSVYVLIRSTSIVWIATFGYFLLGRRPSWGELFACFFVVCGSLASCLSKSMPHDQRALAEGSILDIDDVSDDRSMLKGLLLCIGSTIANGAALIMTKKILSGGAVLRGMSGPDFVFYQAVANFFLLSIAIVPLEGSGVAILLIEPDRLGILCFGVLLTVVYQISLVGLVAATAPLTKEVISQTKIIPQTILAVWLFGEDWGWLTVLSMGLVICGSLLYSVAVSVSKAEDARNGSKMVTEKAGLALVEEEEEAAPVTRRLARQLSEEDTTARRPRTLSLPDCSAQSPSGAIGRAVSCSGDEIDLANTPSWRQRNRRSFDENAVVDIFGSSESDGEPQPLLHRLAQLENASLRGNLSRALGDRIIAPSLTTTGTSQIGLEHFFRVNKEMDESPRSVDTDDLGAQWLFGDIATSGHFGKREDAFSSSLQKIMAYRVGPESHGGSFSLRRTLSDRMLRGCGSSIAERRLARPSSCRSTDSSASGRFGNLATAYQAQHAAKRTRKAAKKRRSRAQTLDINWLHSTDESLSSEFEIEAGEEVYKY